MVLRTTFFSLVFGALVLAACDRPPQAPSPVTPPQASIPPTVPPPTPAPTPPPTGSAIIGLYTLTLTIGSSCTAVPDNERTRKYTASIDDSGSGRYVVTLGDAAFLNGPICTFGSGRFSGIGCHQFFAGEDIDTANFFLENNNDEAHGGHIVEQTSSGTWMEIIGNATGRLNSSSMEASGTGIVWYCPVPMGYPYPCISHTGCQSADIRLTFARK
jgi:hypothetical protein